jgi:DHA1 family tetracycline resistance protein-like MFS transporter
LLAAFAFMGIVGPTLQSIISRTGSRTTQGIRLGAASSLNSFTGAVSPVIGTPLLFCTTQNAPNDIAAGTPYFLAAFLVAAALLLSQHLGIGKAITDNQQ